MKVTKLVAGSFVLCALLLAGCRGSASSSSSASSNASATKADRSKLPPFQALFGHWKSVWDQYYISPTRMTRKTEYMHFDNVPYTLTELDEEKRILTLKLTGGPGTPDELSIKLAPDNSYFEETVKLGGEGGGNMNELTTRFDYVDDKQTPN